MKVPPAPDRYDRGAWQSILQGLAQAVGQSFARGQDLRLQNGERLILRAPNGSMWALKVDNAGSLSTVTTP